MNLSPISYQPNVMKERSVSFQADPIGQAAKKLQAPLRDAGKNLLEMGVGAVAGMTMVTMQQADKTEEAELQSPSEYRARITEVDKQKYIDRLPENTFKFAIKENPSDTLSAYIFDGKESDIVKKDEDGKFYAKYAKTIPNSYFEGKKEVKIGDVIVYYPDETDGMVQEIIPETEFAERYVDKDGKYDALYETKPGIENSVSDIKRAINIVGINFPRSDVYDYSVSDKPADIYINKKREFIESLLPCNDEGYEALSLLTDSRNLIPYTLADLKNLFGIEAQLSPLENSLLSQAIYKLPGGKTLDFKIWTYDIMRFNSLIGFINTYGAFKSGRDLYMNEAPELSAPLRKAIKDFIKDTLGDSAITPIDKFRIEQITGQKYNPENIEPVLGDESRSIMLIGEYRYPYIDSNGEQKYIELSSC